ncbi:atonal -like protein [Labeo rohita]|uniref:Atonal-like protein n=1 Tax=Labeo rohita TaxID=84645 RepID=A0A498LXN1_LABRO|nr:atonal -like protein [Labeo rohita]
MSGDKIFNEVTPKLPGEPKAPCRTDPESCRGAKSPKLTSAFKSDGPPPPQQQGSSRPSTIKWPSAARRGHADVPQVPSLSYQKRSGGIKEDTLGVELRGILKQQDWDHGLLPIGSNFTDLTGFRN